VKTWTRVQEVTVEQGGNQVIRGSLHTAVWAWWKFAGSQAEVSGRRTDPVEEPEAVQKTEGSVEVLDRTPMYSSSAHLMAAR